MSQPQREGYALPPSVETPSKVDSLCVAKDEVIAHDKEGTEPFRIGGMDENDITKIKESESDITTPDENIVYNDNPYVGTGLMTDDWRYPVFEIFRGAEAVSFECSVFYKRDYLYIFPNDDEYTPGYANKLRFEVTLPQATHVETWAEQINAYYQEMLPEYIREGEDFWVEHYNVWWHGYGITYYYEGAYYFGNVITVMRSCFREIGSRLSLGWVPFADLFSAIDGRQLEMDDLFQVEREVYLPILQTSLCGASDRFKEGYQAGSEWEDWYRTAYSVSIIENFNMASVAVTPIGLVFIYPPGCASSNTSGVVFLDVPYVDLHGILSQEFFPALVAPTEVH